MLLAFVLAASAGVPTLDATLRRYPTALTIAGEGDTLHLVDAHGKEIPTLQALVVVDDAYDAAIYNRRKHVRTAVAASLLGVGGLAALSGLQSLPLAGGGSDAADSAAGALVLGAA